MPWPRDHKARTHDRIVRAASAAFRARGVAGVRVEEIMARVGLTHGGFYGHFPSKDALLGEALAHASGQTIERLSAALAAVPADERLHAVIDAYLSPEHAAHPERGCPVAALGPEIARADRRRHRELATAVKERLRWLGSLVPKRKRNLGGDEELVGALACMVGGLILARLAGRAGSADILAACRQFLHRALDDTSGRST